MQAVESNGLDSAAEIAQTINGHISPWKWGVALAAYFPFSQLLSVLGSQNPGVPSYAFIILLMQAIAGGLLGVLMAFGTRNVVKAIRC
tara:strand:+ start:355 stop:618 length:264 start_codon:yes stop_codon:yes gene_type:complete